MRNYQIYQLKDTIDNKDVLFCGLNEMKRQKGPVDVNRYDAIYAGDMPPGMEAMTLQQTAEASTKSGTAFRPFSITRTILPSSYSASPI